MTRRASLLEATYVSGIEGGKAAFPDARPTLLELRERGFLLGAVTNRAFGGERFRADLRDAGLDIGWDAEVGLGGGRLPQAALGDLRFTPWRSSSVGPQEALMVGNSLAEDVAGAQRVGIAAAWRRCAPMRRA